MEYDWRIAINKNKKIYLTHLKGDKSYYSIDVLEEDKWHLLFLTHESFKIGEDFESFTNNIKNFLFFHEASELPSFLTKHSVNYKKYLTTPSDEDENNKFNNPYDEYRNSKYLH